MAKKPIVLKPEVREFLVTNILPYFNRGYYNDYNLSDFIIFTQGITNIDVLAFILLAYMEIVNVPDEYYSFLYDNTVNLILDEAGETKLDQEWIDFLKREDVVIRIEQERNILEAICRMINQTLVTNKHHLQY